MQVLNRSVLRVMGGLFISSGLFLALAVAGCGGSGESVGALPPEAKKSLDAAKVGSPNPFVKDGKIKGGSAGPVNEGKRR